jgi:hypothetical protein
MRHVNVTSTRRWLVQSCLLSVITRTCFLTSIEFGLSGIAGGALSLFWGAGRTEEQPSWPANVELRKIWVQGAEEQLVYNKITVGGNF